MDLADRNTRTMLGYKLESQTTDEIELDLLKAYYIGTVGCLPSPTLCALSLNSSDWQEPCDNDIKLQDNIGEGNKGFVYTRLPHKININHYGNIGGVHGKLLEVALSQEHELQKIEQ